MTTKKIYTLMLCVFCMYFTVKAQDITIQEIHNRIQNSSPTEAQLLDYLAFGSPNSLFINVTNGPSKHVRQGQVVDNIEISNQDDLSTLTNSFPNELTKVKILTLKYNNIDKPEITKEILQKLPELQYIYIQSRQKIGQVTIRNQFSDLFNLLKTEKPNVVILYQSLDEPS